MSKDQGNFGFSVHDSFKSCYFYLQNADENRTNVRQMSWPAAVCGPEQLQYANPCYFFPIPHELSEAKGDVWGKIALFYLQCFPDLCLCNGHALVIPTILSRDCTKCQCCDWGLSDWCLLWCDGVDPESCSSENSVQRSRRPSWQRESDWRQS